MIRKAPITFSFSLMKYNNKVLAWTRKEKETSLKKKKNKITKLMTSNLQAKLLIWKWIVNLKIIKLFVKVSFLHLLRIQVCKLKMKIVKYNRIKIQIPLLSLNLDRLPFRMHKINCNRSQLRKHMLRKQYKNYSFAKILTMLIKLFLAIWNKSKMIHRRR